MKVNRVLVLSLMLFATKLYAVTAIPQPAALLPAISVSSAPTVANVPATVTITTAPNSGPFSTGLLTYVNHIHVEALSVGSIAQSTTLVTCTTTNLGGTPGINFTVAPATGSITVSDLDISSPLQSTNPGNIVISCPANANIKWNLWASFSYQQQ